MKQYSIISILGLCLMLNSCKEETTPVSTQVENSTIDSLILSAEKYERSNTDSMLYFIQEADNLAESDKDKYAPYRARLSFLHAQYYSAGHDDSTADKYIQIAKEEAEESDDFKTLSDVYNYLGTQHFIKKEYSEAISSYKKLEEYARLDEDEKKANIAELNIAAVYQAEGEVKKALETYYKLIPYFEKEEDYYGLSIVFGNIGGLHIKLSENEDALEAIDKAIAAFEKSDRPEDRNLVLLYTNKGTSLTILDRPYEAINTFNKALALSEKLKLSQSIKIRYLQAEQYAQLDSNKKAMAGFQSALKEAKESGDFYYMYEASKLYGMYLYNHGHKQQGVDILEKAIEYSKELEGSHNTYEVYDVLSQHYAEGHNYEKAYKNYFTYREEKDSIINSENLLLSKTQKLNYEHGLEIKESELKAEQAQKNYLQRLFAILVLLIVALSFSFLIWYRYTQKRKREVIILDKNKKLEAKNKIIRKTVKELEQANNDLESFAYASAHDIKNPINTIYGFLQLISMDDSSQLSDESLEYLDNINSSITRLIELLDSILHYTSVNSHEIETEEIDTQKKLDQVTMMLRSPILKSGAEIEFKNTLPNIKVEPLLINQLFLNIISNSIKYHRQGVSPKITIGAEETDDYIVISISDNGIGIPENEMDSIFELFSRAKNSSDFEGTGVGLAVTKKIMDLHNGKITVQNNDPDPGVTFKLYFQKP